jgi:hypothetical protein
MPVHPDDLLWSRPKSHAGALEKTVGLLLFTAACLASLGAYAGFGGVCIYYDGANSCLGRESEFALYLALSVVGLVAAGLALHFAFRGPRRAFVAFLFTTLVLYVASALFADAGTHGWDSLKLFPG